MNPDDAASNSTCTVEECYIADLDPTDPDAAFRISDLSPLSSENVIGWNATSGRVYSIYWTSNLLGGFPAQPFASNITAGAFTDEVHSAESDGFYKIEVELE